MRGAIAIALLVAAGPLANAAHAGLTQPPPQIARPNPAVYSVRVDYIDPPRTPTGEVASLPPLLPAAAAAAVADQQFLTFQIRGDLGGFIPAPIGQLELSSGGHAVVGRIRGKPELPLFAQAAGGKVDSFTFTSGPLGPPDNGKQPVPGGGVPPVVAPPTNSNTVPPPNQGFGGRPVPPKPPATTTTTTTTTPRPPPTTTTSTTTTTRTTTTTTTTTTTATTTTAAPAPPPTSAGGSCGAPGIAIESNLSGCRIDARNMRPGDSTAELVTVTNTSDSSYTLSLKATGIQNRLWQDLRLGVWEAATAAPSPLPPLLDWTTQFNSLTTLAPGHSVTYEVELLLPTSAGNEDQASTASISFVWRASG
jgi:hypothetical protein